MYNYLEWTDMCKQCDNVLKFEVPNPLKSERKVLKRKNFDMETNSEDEDRIENDLKKNRTVCEYNDVDAYKVFINAWFFNFINSVLIFLY